MTDTHDVTIYYQDGTHSIVCTNADTETAYQDMHRAIAVAQTDPNIERITVTNTEGETTVEWLAGTGFTTKAPEGTQ